MEYQELIRLFREEFKKELKKEEQGEIPNDYFKYILQAFDTAGIRAAVKFFQDKNYPTAPVGKYPDPRD
jgi:hypothetical protein